MIQFIKKRWKLITTITAIIIISFSVVTIFNIIAYHNIVDHPDTMQITVVNKIDLPQSSSIVFSKKFTTQTQAIYDQITKRPLPENTVQNCPTASFSMPYYAYTITFYHGSTQTATATAESRFCEDISITYLGGFQKSYFWLASNNRSFWKYLNKLTGAPISVANETFGNP